MLNDPIVIVGLARTPMAAFQGDFASSMSEIFDDIFGDYFARNGR